MDAWLPEPIMQVVLNRIISCGRKGIV